MIPSGKIPIKKLVKILVKPLLEALPQLLMNLLVSSIFNLAIVLITTSQRDKNPLQQLFSNFLPKIYWKYKIATSYKDVIDFSFSDANSIIFTISFGSCFSSSQEMVERQQAKAG